MTEEVATLAEAVDGIGQVKMQVRADGGLNCRFTPRIVNGVLSNKIGLIPDGETILVFPQITHLRDGFDWILSFSSLGYGFVAKQFLRIEVEDDEPLPDPVPEPKPRNRIGWHILPGAPVTFLDMLRRLHQKDKPVPIVRLPFITDGRIAFTVKQIREASPRTKIIARIFTGNDYYASEHGGWDRVTRQHGRDYFEVNKVLITPDIASADFVQIRDLNEPGVGLKMNDWFHGLLDGAEAMGIKACIYTFSVGNPGLPDDARPYRDFWKWESTWNLLRRVKANGHCFSLQQYAYADQWTDKSRMMRHYRIYSLLPADLQNLPLYLTEFGESFKAEGTPNDRSPERYAARLRTANKMLIDGPGSPIACLWTLGDSGGWERDRLEGIMLEYERFAMEVAA